MSASRLSVACRIVVLGGVADRVAAVQAPRPLDGAGAEHERSARPPVHGQVVRRRADLGPRAVVVEDLDARHRGRGEPELAGRPEAVVGVLVPLVAERLRRQRRRSPVGQARDGGVAPQTQVLVGRRDRDRRRAGVDEERGAGQRVLRRRLGRRGEARVAPRAGPGDRIGAGPGSACPCSSPASGSPLRGCAQRVFQNTSLPLKKARLSPASRAASTFSRWLPRPVLVVAAGDEGLVGAEQVAAGVAVDVGGVAHVEAVGLEEADHRVLGRPPPRRRAGRRERAVVRDGVRRVVAVRVARPGTRPRTGRGCCRRSCCTPARWRRRSGPRRRSVLAVVAHHERDVAAAAVVRALEVGDVEARDGGARDVPGGRGGPVAAVDQAGRRARRAGRLVLRRGVGEAGDHAARAVAGVVADAVDVDACSPARWCRS